MPLESNFIGWLLFLLLYHGTPSGVLAEGVTVHEVMGDLVVANVPGEVTLEDAIRESVAEFVDDGIQAGLGGVALPTAIKDGNEVIANLSDQVAMETNLRDAVLGGNSRVAVAPVLVCLDGGVHEGFDLAHVVVWFVWYAPIIDTGSDDLQVVVCHFRNWFGSEDDDLPSHGTIQHAVDQSEHSALMWETVKPVYTETAALSASRSSASHSRAAASRYNLSCSNTGHSKPSSSKSRLSSVIVYFMNWSSLSVSRACYLPRTSVHKGRVNALGRI